MKSQKPRPGKGGRTTRLSFVVFGIAVLTAACSYGYGVYAESKRQDALLPRLALASLVRDARKFEALTGRMPRSFDEIEEFVWKHKGLKPAFDKSGTAYALGNYLYIIHGIDTRATAVWAVPVGPRRDEESSHYVIISTIGIAHWKGAAIKLDDFDKLTPNPEVSELAALGLVRQPDEKQDPKTTRAPVRLPSTRPSAYFDH